MKKGMNFLDKLKDLNYKATVKAFKAGEETDTINLEAVNEDEVFYPATPGDRVDNDEEPKVECKKTIPQRLDEIDAQIKDIFECLINMQKTHMAITRKQCELMGKMLELIENNPMRISK